MDRAREDDRNPDFVVCPDKVADSESLEFSRSWADICRGGLPETPCFLAVQDGMKITPDTLEGFDGVFVGGTIPWKIRTGEKWTQLAHSVGLQCHIGRVGTAKRVKWAQRIGADSIDSSLPLWSKDNLRIFVTALNNRQIELFS